MSFENAEGQCSQTTWHPSRSTAHYLQMQCDGTATYGWGDPSSRSGSPPSRGWGFSRSPIKSTGEQNQAAPELRRTGHGGATGELLVRTDPVAVGTGHGELIVGVEPSASGERSRWRWKGRGGRRWTWTASISKVSGGTHRPAGRRSGRNGTRSRLRTLAARSRQHGRTGPALDALDGQSRAARCRTRGSTDGSPVLGGEGDAEGGEAGVRPLSEAQSAPEATTARISPSGPGSCGVLRWPLRRGEGGVVPGWLVQAELWGAPLTQTGQSVHSDCTFKHYSAARPGAVIAGPAAAADATRWGASGLGRHVLVHGVKNLLAALLAWVVATPWIPGEPSYVAVATALLMVNAETVYRIGDAGCSGAPG